MLKIFTFIGILGCLLSTGAWGQQRPEVQFTPRLQSADSVVLFHSETDQNGSNDILKSRGHIRHIRFQPSGGFDVFVWRQQVGYFETTPKLKSLPSGINALPSLVQLQYDPAKGLRQASHQYINLNSGFQQPLNYRLLDLTSVVGGAATQGNVVLTSHDTAPTMEEVLREKGNDALAFKSYTWPVVNYLVSPDRKKVLMKVEPTYFAPYPAEDLTAPATTKELFVLSDKSLAANQVGPLVVSRQEGRPVITVFKALPTPAFVTLDSTGKVFRTTELPELKERVLLASNSILDAATTGEWVSANMGVSRQGIDYVFGVERGYSGWKDAQFTVVRVLNDGTIAFRHSFKAEYEGYSPSDKIQVASNANECIVNVTLGKGIMKWAESLTKVTSKGIVYTAILTKDDYKNAGLVTGYGSGLTSEVPTTYWYLLSLPNGENMIVGEYFYAGSPIFSYHALHLNAKGNLLRNYATRRFTSNLNVLRYLHCVALADGRVVLTVNEPLALSNAALTPYSLLDYELAGGYPATTKGLWSEKVPTVLFNPISDGNRDAKGSVMGKLEALANESAAPRAGEAIAKDRRPSEAPEAPYVTSMFVIDPKAQTFRPYTLAYKKMYVIPSHPHCRINRQTGEFMAWGRTFPDARSLPIRLPSGDTRQGRAVFLKVLKGQL